MTNLVVNVPIPGRISTENSSPSRRYSFGEKPWPTPAGVPVKMIVPALSVVPCERKLTILGTEKIKSLRSMSVLVNFVYVAEN